MTRARYSLIAAFALAAAVPPATAQFPDSIATPAAADTVRVGDTVTVRIIMRSQSAVAGLELVLRDGENVFGLPRTGTYQGTFNPQDVPVVTFVMPPYIVDRTWDFDANGWVYDTIRTTDGPVRVRLIDYNTHETLAESGAFTVLPAAARVEPRSRTARSQTGPRRFWAVLLNGRRIGPPGPDGVLSAPAAASAGPRGGQRR